MLFGRSGPGRVNPAGRAIQFGQFQGGRGLSRPGHPSGNPFIPRPTQPGANNPAAPANYQAPPPTGVHDPSAPVNVQPGATDPRGALNVQEPGNPGSGGVSPQPGPGGIIRGGGGKGGGKGAQPPTPFDAEYYGNVANYLFKTNNAIAGFGQQAADERTALQSALGQLRYAQPRANLAAEERANQEGALYSTAYGQQLGDLNNQYLTKQSGLTGSTAGKLAALAQRIAALRGSVPLYENSQGYLSAQRLAAAAAKNPALGKRTGPLTRRAALNYQVHPPGGHGNNARGRH